LVGSFFASGADGLVVELEPLLEGEELPVEDGLDDGDEGDEDGDEEEGDEDGVLEVVPPLLPGALSPQAVRARAVAAAISRALVIPDPLRGVGGPPV
jgi:hypothetical protein